VDVFDLTGHGIALRFEDGNADGRPDLLAPGSSAGSAGGTAQLGLAFIVHQLGPWSGTRVTTRPARRGMLLARRRTMQRIALAVLVLVPTLSAQQPAFYPGVDLPLDTPVIGQVSAFAPSGLPLADARLFTATPHDLVRDLDGDTHLDATWLRDGELWVFRGHGDGRFDGTFQVAQILPATAAPTGLFGDVTGDGHADAVFLGQKSIEVFVDQADGTFASSGLVTIVSPGIISAAWGIGDANADGKNDILCGTGGLGAFLSFMRGLGDGTFAPPVQLVMLDNQPWGMAVGDVNGDGLADATVVLSTSGSSYQLQVVTLGPVVKHPTVPVPAHPAMLQVRDMTGDGLPDALVGDGQTLLLYAGDGAGNLAATPQLVPGAGNESVFADVDGDGLVDVITSDNQQAQPVNVLFATAQGFLALPIVTPHRAPPLDTGDFDGDGQLDLFSSRAVLLGRADGHFAVPRAFDLGAGAESAAQVQFADFDGDGRSDVLSVELPVEDAAVVLSEPGATWSAPIQLATGNKLRASAAGDVDGDGDADVLAGWWLGGQADTWLGDGQGGFAAGPQLSLGTFVEMTVVGVGHLDANAAPDIVAAEAGQLVVRRGMGNLQFAAAQITSLPGPGLMQWIIVRDLSGDGLDDVVIGLPTPHVFRSVGHGEFAAPVAVGTPSHTMTAHDVDGDGLLDLVATNFEQVSVHLQQGGAWVPAPFPELISTRDVLGTALADVDGDGLLDIALGHERAWSLHLGVPGGGWAPQAADIFDLTGNGVALRFEDGNSDGRPDLLAAGGGITSETVPTHWLGLTFAPHQLGPWADAGFALPGHFGEPYLWPEGSLQPASPLRIVLRDAATLVPVFLFVGLAPAMVPFKGGTMVPDPLLLLAAGATDGDGFLQLDAAWPAGVPSGTQVWLQAWVQDVTGPAGFAASNGVAGTAP
jgi:FG-GAP-like repeat